MFLSQLCFHPSACAYCEKAWANRDGLHPREIALVKVLSVEVPRDTREYLHWHAPSDILHSLRFTIRYRKYLDGFCGIGGVTASFIRNSLPSGASLDLELGDRSHDITTPEGFGDFLQYSLEMVPMSLAVLGPPCSTFVFLSRGTTKRHASNRWLGDTSRLDVSSANVIAARVTTLCKLFVLRLIQFLVEQPLTSCFWSLYVWKRFVRGLPSLRRGKVVLHLMRRCVWMGHWGAIVPKPTILWGIASAMSLLVSKRPKSVRSVSDGSVVVKQTTLKTIIKGGKRVNVFRIYGVRKDLKKTQQYPRRFCDELVGSVKEHLKSPLACYRGTD